MTTHMTARTGTSALSPVVTSFSRAIGAAMPAASSTVKRRGPYRGTGSTRRTGTSSIVGWSAATPHAT
jgi:hypothetical protein